MISEATESIARQFIQRAQSFPKLSREEEHDVAVQARAGDQDAAHKLIEANLRYVVAVALQYRRYGIPLGDLIAEGNLGLMMAIRKFDPDRGTRFVTYAGYWIRAYILDLVVRSATMVGAGSGPFRSKLFFRLRRERAKVANLVSDPEERTKRLAAEFGVTPERIESLMHRLDSRDVSLDQTLFDDSGTTLLDNLEAGTPDQEAMFMASETSNALHDKLSEALEQLDRRERYIVEERYLKDRSKSLAAIGRTLGVSRERARQLEARAKQKLKNSLGDVEELTAA
jgi:RNA polymerase sigma-32 factor